MKAVITVLFAAAAALAFDAGPLLPFIDQPTVVSDDVTAGLVAWWKFDDSFSDSSGNGYTLTNNGCEFISGRIGNALSLVAAENDYAIGRGSGLPDGTNARTVSMWCKLSSVSDQVALFYGKEFSDQAFMCLPMLYGKVSIGFFNDSPLSSAGLDTGVWHHLVFIYEGAGNVVYYIDTIRTTNYTGFNPSTYLEGPLYIGRLGTINGYSFNGLLDDVRIYNRALTSNEVARIYEKYK